jgi:hypothetical protein
MFVFVDEAGNTGGNLFDEEQPWFLTIGLMTRANFDVLEPRLLANGAGSNGDFHGNALGPENIERIAPALLMAAKRRDARFFVSRLEKLYLATAKLFKLANYVLNREVVKLFWTALMHKNSKRSAELFIEACKAILVRVA